MWHLEEFPDLEYEALRETLEMKVQSTVFPTLNLIKYLPAGKLNADWGKQARN